MCSGSLIQAEEYGPTYIIVPCTGWTCCFSPNYYDLYQQMTDQINDKLNKSREDDWDYHDERDLSNLVFQLYRAGNYKSGKGVLATAVQSNNEIMLYPTDGVELAYYKFTEEFWNSTVIPLVSRK